MHLNDTHKTFDFYSTTVLQFLRINLSEQRLGCLKQGIKEKSSFEKLCLRGNLESYKAKRNYFLGQIWYKCKKYTCDLDLLFEVNFILLPSLDLTIRISGRSEKKSLDLISANSALCNKSPCRGDRLSTNIPCLCFLVLRTH